MTMTFIMNNNLNSPSSRWQTHWRLRSAYTLVLLIGCVNTVAGLAAILSGAEFFSTRQIDLATLGIGLTLWAVGMAFYWLIQQNRLRLAILPLVTALGIMVVVGFIGGSSSADLNVELGVGLVVRTIFAIVLLQSIPLLWQREDAA